MSNSGRVLVVEDHETERRAVSQILKSEGFTVFGAENADKAMGYLDENIDVVLSDLHMGDVSGIDLLQLWKKRKPDTQFILLTGHSSVNSAVEAIKGGAYDYLTKPINPDELVLLIKRAVETLSQGQGDRQPPPPARPEVRPGPDHRPVQADEGRVRQDPEGRAGGLHGADPGRKRHGQGTGRPGAAPQQPAQEGAVRRGERARRCRRRWWRANCSATCKGAFTGATDRRIGRFEQADGGTLFIDEIGDFDLALQAKLLRVLETLTLTPVGGHEDRKVNVRVVAATSRDIRKMVDEGKFREDLYYRLNVVTDHAAAAARSGRTTSRSSSSTS